MPVAVDPYKLQQVLKELEKHYTKEIATLKQSVARLEQRVASLEKTQTAKP